MKKWLDKYNDDVPQAQNGIEGTMGGLTDQGFNYNGAWGGTMQMGGSMPGAVGFTYARTGSIPSNGPYAKKTKASAQNGKEMKFYQEGLDWKPRNISQDGTSVKKPRTDMLTMDEYRLQQAIANQPVIQSPKGKQLSKEQIFAKNKQYAEAQGKRFNPNTGAVTPFLSPSTARTFERASENIVEPMMDLELGMGAASLLRQGLKKTAGKFVKPNTKLKEVVDQETGISRFGRDADGMYEEVNNRRIYSLDPPPSEITMGQPTRRSLIQLTENDYNDLLKFTNAGDQITDKSLSKFRNILTNRRYDTGVTMANDSYLGMQNALRTSLNNRVTYPNAVSNIVQSYSQFQSRPPIVYANYHNWGTPNWNVTNNRSAPNKIASYIGNSLRKVDENLGKLVFKNQQPTTYDGNELLSLINENLSKGMGVKKTNIPLEVRFQEGLMSPDNRSLDLRTFVGGQETGGINLNRNLIPYSKPKPLSKILFGNRTNNAQEAWQNTIGFKKLGDFPFGNYSNLNSIQDASGKVFSNAEDFYNVGLSGEFNKAINESLKSKGLGNILSGGTGHSERGAARWEKLVNKGMAHKFGSDNAQSYYMLKRNGGEIPVDPMGYWNPDNVGEPVIIPSNEITMEGVYQPLLGISDTGDTQMMYPGEDYEFDGESVTEYPMAKSGMSVNNADAQPIEKLDQLLNFTNYNKPTKGGWLDKYQ